MKRTAVYARYSSDEQNQRSADDQIALCKDYAAKHGLNVVAAYKDEDISGASIANRPGIQALLASAERHLFDCVLAENFKRLSRSKSELPRLKEDLDFYQVQLFTVHSGAASDMGVVMEGFMGSQQLKEIADQTRRGLGAVNKNGRFAGGRIYGYKPLPALPGEARGRLEIVESEAKVVREIFRLYASGVSPRAIAKQLNKRRIEPPGNGKSWSATSLMGNAKRGSGILNNETYRGVLVWNKVTFVSRHGKRISRVNPKDQWQTAKAERLRIVDESLWNAARARKASAAGKKPHELRREHLLSGLLKCGCCGAAVSTIGNGVRGARMQCRCYRESGGTSCTNKIVVYRADIESVVLSGLQDVLQNKDAIAECFKEYERERKRNAKTADRDRAKLTRRKGEVDRELDRLFDAIAQGVGAAKLKDRINSLEAELEQIKHDLAVKPETELALHPKLAERYLQAIDKLATNDSDEVRATVRELIGAVTLNADKSVHVVGLLWPIANSARVLQGRYQVPAQ